MSDNANADINVNQKAFEIANQSVSTVNVDGSMVELFEIVLEDVLKLKGIHSTLKAKDEIIENFDTVNASNDTIISEIESTDKGACIESYENNVITDTNEIVPSICTILEIKGEIIDILDNANAFNDTKSKFIITSTQIEAFIESDESIVQFDTSVDLEISVQDIKITEPSKQVEIIEISEIEIKVDTFKVEETPQVQTTEIGEMIEILSVKGEATEIEMIPIIIALVESLIEDAINISMVDEFVTVTVTAATLESVEEDITFTKTAINSDTIQKLTVDGINIATLVENIDIVFKDVKETLLDKIDEDVPISVKSNDGKSIKIVTVLSTPCEISEKDVVMSPVKVSEEKMSLKIVTDIKKVVPTVIKRKPISEIILVQSCWADEEDEEVPTQFVQTVPLKKTDESELKCATSVVASNSNSKDTGIQNQSNASTNINTSKLKVIVLDNLRQNRKQSQPPIVVKKVKKVDCVASINENLLKGTILSDDAIQQNAIGKVTIIKNVGTKKKVDLNPALLHANRNLIRNGFEVKKVVKGVDSRNAKDRPVERNNVSISKVEESDNYWEESRKYYDEKRRIRNQNLKKKDGGKF